MELCKGCHKREIDTSRSISYCIHCLELRHRANKKYRESHKQDEYRRIQDWNKRNPEKIKQYSKNNYTKNGYKYKDLKREYKQTPSYKAKAKIYREKNKVKINLQSRKWQAENPKRVEINKKNWIIKNPNKPIEYVHARRAREKSAEGKFTSSEWEDLQKFYGNKCLWCGKSPRKLSPDHVIPLSKGGTNYISNIQPLCPSCNSKKNTRIIDFRPLGSFILEWT